MNRPGTLRASDAVRASDADRERIVERLHKAATEGRIAPDELEQRVSAALKARTYGELEETVFDLPGARNRRQPATAPRSTGAWAVAMVRANPILILFALPIVAVVSAMLLAATIVWMVMIVVVMLLGGRPQVLRPPWGHTRRHGRHHRGSRSFSYWA